MTRVRASSYAGTGRAVQRQPPTRWGAAGALLLCATLLSAYAITSWSAVLRKSAAIDEPTRAVAGWMQLARGDFRVNPEDPPLLKFLIARPNARAELHVDRDPELWQRLLDDSSESPFWCRAVLYGTDGGAATADALLARSRAAMIAVAVALGAMIGWWAWKIAGPTAAVVAVGLFSLDPNFLAHGPLLAGDVAMSLAMLAAVYAVWRCGRRASVFRIAVVALLAAVALALGYSGVLVLAIVAAVVVGRVFVPASWPLLGRFLRKWWGRYAVAAVVIVIMLGVSIAGLWGSYLFRFRPAPDATAAMNMAGIVAEVAATEGRLQARGNRRLATQPVEEPSAFVRFATYMDAKRLLPQAWIYGLLDTHRGLLTRQAYLFGQSRRGGWWYYFPVAMALKTPLATTAALGLAVWALLSAWKRYGAPAEAGAWTITCVALPVVLYLFFAMLARLDFGVRHVLPVYPFLFIAIGVAASLAAQRRRAGATWAIVLLLFGVATETVLAFPHFVPFFNAPARAWCSGVHVLGESNVDLGQDLPLLATWQRENPSRKLYVSYFGPADPALYGIKAIDVRREGIDLRPRWPADKDAVIAVSATYLQGFAIDPESRILYSELRAREPLAILGGSIYLYDLAPTSVGTTQLSK